MRYYDSFHGNLSGRQESAIARKKLEAIQSKDVRGLKYFDRLAPLLQRLHDDGCARYKAANRLLFYDQYSMLILLYFFNPTVTSLRAIQQASEVTVHGSDIRTLPI